MNQVLHPRLQPAYSGEGEGGNKISSANLKFLSFFFFDFGEWWGGNKLTTKKFVASRTPKIYLT